MSEEFRQPGFDAISAALERLYSGKKGLYYGTAIPYTLGGPDPLDGVEVFKNDSPFPHWHYVSFGFSDLDEKTAPGSEWSGYGFEMTFRLKREGDDPPVWPVNLMQNLARYVFDSGNVFGPGHHIDLNGPIMLEADTKLGALGFFVDPELGEMDTENGRVVFLQAAALTVDEMQALMCWNGTAFLKLLEKALPGHIADLSRRSVMERPEIRETWQQGVDQDGSSTGFLYVDELGWCRADSGWRLRLGAGHTGVIRTMLKARVGKGQPLGLIGPDQGVSFVPGEKTEFSADETELKVTLPETALTELCGLLLPAAQTVRCDAAPLWLDIVPTVIRDRDGNVKKIIQ